MMGQAVAVGVAVAVPEKGHALAVGAGSMTTGVEVVVDCKRNMAGVGVRRKDCAETPRKDCATKRRRIILFFFLWCGIFRIFFLP